MKITNMSLDVTADTYWANKEEKPCEDLSTLLGAVFACYAVLNPFRWHI